MSNNSEISAIFYDMADILEMQQIAWKPIAYRSAARTIESLKQDVKEIYRKGGVKAVENIPNVGESMAKKIEEYLRTGKISEHQKLLGAIPMHIRELMKIPGLGPKKITKLNKILKISSVRQLEQAAKKHKIAKIPTFGAKSEQDILEAISISRGAKGRIPLKEAKEAADGIIRQLKKLKAVNQIEVAGSVRRKKSFVRDLDILASSNSPEKVTEAFTNLPNIKKVLAKGPTKATIILKSGIQTDIRVLKPESWGAGLFYFTGSKNYDIIMRKLAIKKGFKLSEYGLFDKRTGKMVAGRTEKEITDKLGAKLPNPEDRSL